MKKGICLVLVLMCCAWVALPALAEEAPAFDYTLLEDKNGYEYDKFDKTWAYRGMWIDTLTLTFLSTQVEGANNTLQVPPVLLTYKSGLEPKSMDLLIGETVITIDLDRCTEDGGLIYLGSSEEDLVRALLDAEELSVRIVGKEEKVIFDISKEQYANSNFKYSLGIILQYQLLEDTNWSEHARSTYNNFKPVITVH